MCAAWHRQSILSLSSLVSVPSCSPPLLPPSRLTLIAATSLYAACHYCRLRLFLFRHLFVKRSRHTVYTDCGPSGAIASRGLCARVCLDVRVHRASPLSIGALSAIHFASARSTWALRLPAVPGLPFPSPLGLRYPPLGGPPGHALWRAKIWIATTTSCCTLPFHDSIYGNLWLWRVPCLT